MRTQSMDTRPEAEQFQIALIRKTLLIKWFCSAADYLEAVIPLLEIFEQMDIISYIQGEVAIAAYGMQRGVTSIEVGTDLQTKHIASLLAKLDAIYSIDKDEVQNAVNRRTTFRGVHRDSLMKLTVFLTKDCPFNQEVLRRVQTHILAENQRPFYLASPEDIILTQLEAYKRGGGRDGDRWTDLLGVLKVQGTPLDLTYLQKWANVIDLPYQRQWTSSLDFTYLQQWATTLEVADLLERALTDAGIKQG